MLTDADNIRWDLMEDLYRSYLVGVADEDRADWFDQYQSLNADEREVLAWKMEEGDSAIDLIRKAMHETGARTIAELGRAKRTRP